MTTFFLIRHAAHDLLGKTLAGRMAGVHLNRIGEWQAAHLAERLRREPVGAVLSSPSTRARETAMPIARRLGRDVEIDADLDEIDFGEWTGRSFDELAPQPDWQRFNSFRSGAHVPGGETMLQAQTRIVGLMHRLGRAHPDTHIVLVSHGDVIKSAVAYHLGVPLDLFQRIEIGPASISIVALEAHGPRILQVNGRLDATDPPGG